MRRANFEIDDETFPADAYAVAGYRGVAFYIYGWEIERYWDESEGIYADDPAERRTGRVVAVMVGDDRQFTFEPDELTALADLDFCGVCGQLGCSHDGRDRE